MEFSNLEVIGFAFGVIGVWLTIKENIWCFPVGLVNVLISMVLFFDQKLYSDVIQQIVYVILLVYGWYRWHTGKVNNNTLVSRSGYGLILTVIAIAVILTASMGTVFNIYTDASVPYIDAAATSLSFAAQYLIARKKIENWLIWMVVNLTYISVYFYKELYLYALLFAVYLVMAVVGYVRWRKIISH
jgi:nicotinamide mononucleotide transporter